jgi:Parvovirus coat protein VP1.
MPFVSQSRRKVSNPKTGKGFINSLINKLPFELHLPGYQYCGPGTKFQKRIARGDPGVNPLDQACKIHDGAYEDSKDLPIRHKADYELEQRAWQRVKSKDANFKEKAAAWLVTNIMKAKRRLGMGCNSKPPPRRKVNKRKNIKKKKVNFGGGIVSKVRGEVRKAGGQRFVSNNVQKAAQFALQAARKFVKSSGGKRNIRTPRIIPIPKVGGILPLIPIFAGLSALGSLAGGAAGIYKTISDVKNAKQRLAEDIRHNKEMESVSLGKKGSGLYLKPYRSGLGLYLKPGNSKNF